MAIFLATIILALVSSQSLPGLSIMLQIKKKTDRAIAEGAASQGESIS